MTRRGRPTTTRPYAHACRVYAAMAERSIPLAEAPAEVRALADPATTTPESRVFVGRLIQLFHEVGLTSSAQYHLTKSNLVAVGSLTRLRRGTGRAASVWLLGPAPSVTTWGRAIGQPEQQRLLAKVEAEHHLRLAVFLKDLPSIAPSTAEEMRLAGVRTVGQAIGFLRSLPPARLAGLGPGACLRFVGRVEHTCGAESVLPEPVQPHSPARLVR
jgi:hypothetical protein